MLLAGWSCTQEGDATTVVATEEVIFVSGDKVRVLGRLITDQPVTTTDHGFQISTAENFPSPIIVSLGVKEGPGRFIGEAEGLDINQIYYVRAFATVGGVDLYGESIEVKTLNPIIESYGPTFSKPGAEIIIQGRNLPGDQGVLWNSGSHNT